jgi:tRNA modification GTPase
MIHTIYALATPPGRSGVAVVRASGPDSWAGARELGAKNLRPRMAALAALRHKNEIIDRALILPFKSPASYTGEDIIEYHVHGGHAVVDSLLRALASQKNHRMAEPGEFTRRAFEKGKIDLTAAEAVADLIDAQTQAQKIQALSQMEGGLAKIYEGWTDQLKKILAHLEADIEFPDEDLPGGIAPKIMTEIKNIAAEISGHLNDNQRGERLRDGIRVVILGAPNAGKSSLLNAMARRDLAIVSNLAGTTRDVIEAHLDIAGFPVIFSDTAGLRLGQDNEIGHDAIESEGIRRAKDRAAKSDIKILLFDLAHPPDQETLELRDENAMMVFNKCDLNTVKKSNQSDFFISVITGEGMDEFIAALTEKIKSIAGNPEIPSLTRARHREALEGALECLMRTQTAPLPELIAEDMRLAVRSIGRITGRVSPEDLLDVIFRDFCIGK